MPPSQQPATLAGTRLDRHLHACAFFRSRDEAYRVLIPFIVEGLAWGEKAVHVTSPRHRDDHMTRLGAAGVDTEAEERSGRLEVLTWEDTYLRAGRFDPDTTLDLFEQVLRASHEEGYPRTRIIGDMGWAMEGRPGVDQVMEYEARVNYVLARHRQPSVCAYDLTLLNAETMMDVLRTHPLVIMGETLTENPFFMPPDEFLSAPRD